MAHGLHESVRRVHYPPVQRAEIQQRGEPIDVDYGVWWERASDKYTPNKAQTPSRIYNVYAHSALLNTIQYTALRRTYNTFLKMELSHKLQISATHFVNLDLRIIVKTDLI